MQVLCFFTPIVNKFEGMFNVNKLKKTKTKNKLAYLLAHWFRIGDCCAEETIPFQPAIESRPVIMAVPSVGQTPGDQGIKLPVCRVTRLT